MSIATYRTLPLLLALIATAILPAFAQVASNGRTESIERLVRDDGSLDLSSGYHGSLDAKGWEVRLAPDGSPRFFKASAADAHPDNIYWDDRFGLGGSSGPIYTIAVSGCNDVYIGGRFTWLANILANNVARWDGREWFPLGDGVVSGNNRTATVVTITVDGGDVFVGGAFDSAGSVPARNVARWDGNGWTSLGAGVGSSPNDTVRAIAVDGNIVYAGGSFGNAGGAPANLIARWDRRNGAWAALGSGLSGPATIAPRVQALALYGSDLFVGGSFITAGGQPVDNIARWSPGNNSWSAVGEGPNGTVFALAVSGDDLYAGGIFDEAGGAPAANVALWEIDTKSWHPLGNGVDGPVYGIAVDGSKIYAGGEFAVAGDTTVDRVARWDGRTWTPLATTDDVAGTNKTVRGVAVSGRNVYVAGLFTRAGSLIAYGAANWNIATRTWRSLNIDAGNGVNGPVYAIAVNGQDVYVGGKFTAAGGVRAASIAKWNNRTNAWSALGEGVSQYDPDEESPLGTVNAIAISGKDVYIGGRFDRAGSVDAYNVAHWKNGVWSAMRQGIGYNYQKGSYDATSVVNAIAVNGQDVYVGGKFDQAGGARANRIARWNEADGSWAPLGGGLGGSSFYTYVLAIAVDGSDVYAGGVFPIAGDVDVKNIARWDGSKWNRLGNPGGNNGVNNSVYAIAIGNNGEVYVGGDFKVAGGTLNVSNIAMWNGSKWSNPGNGVNGIVYTIGVANDGIYAGGSFNLAGQIQAPQVARWDGTRWWELGSGIEEFNRQGVVHAIGSNGIDVFVGGEFSLAGKKPSYNLAHWTKLVPGSISTVRDGSPSDRESEAVISPNPATAEATLKITLERRGFTVVTIFDDQGTTVADLLATDLSVGSHEVRWNTGDLPPGLYFCRVRCDDVVRTIPLRLAR